MVLLLVFCLSVSAQANGPVRVSKACADTIQKELKTNFSSWALATASGSRISFGSRISLSLAQDAVALERFSNGKGDSICKRTALILRDDLYAFFEARLRKLLRLHRYSEFSSEVQNLLDPRTSQEQKTLYQYFLADLESEYLAAIRKNLFGRLTSTQWESYQKLSFNVVAWSEEWLGLLGRDAPAAVHYETKRVVLRPLDHTPIALEIFLFHELSHLADPSRQSPNYDEFMSESYAWTQTLGFIEQLRRLGIQIPSLFQNIVDAVREQGMRRWLSDVLASRKTEK